MSQDPLTPNPNHSFKLIQRFTFIHLQTSHDLSHHLFFLIFLLPKTSILPHLSPMMITS